MSSDRTNTQTTDGDGTETIAQKFYAPRDLSVPLDDAVGYLYVGVDPACDPVPGEGYWIPVGENKHSERRHPPRGEIIQYPKDDRKPYRVGDLEVPDHVQDWDYRSDGNDADRDRDRDGAKITTRSQEADS